MYPTQLKMLLTYNESVSLPIFSVHPLVFALLFYSFRFLCVLRFYCMNILHINYAKLKVPLNTMHKLLYCCIAHQSARRNFNAVASNNFFSLKAMKLFMKL